MTYRAGWKICHDDPARRRGGNSACVERSGSDSVVFFCIAGRRRGQPQVTEFQAQGLPGDPQQEGGLLEIAARVRQHARQQEPVHLPVRLRVEVTNIGLDLLPDDERLHAGLCRGYHRQGDRARASQGFG